jgi:hypothetical protein
MTPAAPVALGCAVGFLSSLESCGVEVLLDPAAPSGLRVRAPRGLVTADLAQRIRQAAPQLRSLMEARNVHPGDETTRPDSQTDPESAPERFPSTEVAAPDAIQGEDAAQSEEAQIVLRLYLAWQAGALPDPAEPVTIAKGTTVKSPARWLTANLPRVERLRARYGPCWFRLDKRRPFGDQDGPHLAQALLALAQWWEEVGEGVRAEGARAPEPPA